MHMLERLTTLFAPDNCLHCGREGSLLCRGCRTHLRPVIGRCFGCHSVINGVGCTTCLTRAGLSGVEATASYQGLAKLLVASLKFRGNQSAARIMADCMATLPIDHDALLVHMPATNAHVRERGFDQSKLIARALARQWRVPHADVLRRTGSHHQLGADREQRLIQMVTALSVRGTVKGKQIILVDDVLTTGSSLTAAATALRIAGAEQVEAIVFAQFIT